MRQSLPICMFAFYTWIGCPVQCVLNEVTGNGEAAHNLLHDYVCKTEECLYNSPMEVFVKGWMICMVILNSTAHACFAHAGRITHLVSSDSVNSVSGKLIWLYGWRSPWWRHVALKWQLEVKSHLLVCLILQNHPTKLIWSSYICT